MNAKEEEALKCILEAEKSLKTSFFKRSPDYDSAAEQYSRAATCYKTIRKMEKFVQCNLKAAECYKNNRSYYSAAKAYEAAAMTLGKEMSDWKSGIPHIEKACAMYREHGTPDTAAMCLDRAAKAIESVIPEKAAEFYAVAADVSMIESKSHVAAEYCGKAARVHLKLRNLKQAADMTRDQLTHMIETNDMNTCGRIVVCHVIILLAMDDYVAGRKAFTENRVYVEQHELYTMELLLDGFDSNDPAKIVSALNHPFVKSLDNEITKLIRSMNERFKGKISADAASYEDYERDHQNNREANPDYDEDAAALM